MRQRLLPLLLAFCLLLSACGPASQEAPPDGTLEIVATTYPVYLFASEVTRGATDVSVSLMIDQPVSCLHDYTLTVKDMKALERADMILLSGAGLEESMADALAVVADTPQIDCSQGIALLEGGHDGHDHDHEGGVLPSGHTHAEDPHIWLDPLRACQMLETSADALRTQDPRNAALYQTNAQLATEQIRQAYTVLQAQLADLSCRDLITFHDGFSYFAQAFDLEILCAIEEEAGSEASAQKVQGLVEEIEHHHIPAVFTEVNGADATAQIIHRECGVPIFSLDLMMSRQQEQTPGVTAYLTLLQSNVNTLREAYS